MITVRTGDGYITIEGHAEFAPPGQDIVCAGVTALVQTLALALERSEPAEDISINIAPGRAVFEYDKLTDAGKINAGSFLVGMNWLAETYPDYVQVGPEAIAPGGKNGGGGKDEA